MTPGQKLFEQFGTNCTHPLGMPPWGEVHPLSQRAWDAFSKQVRPITTMNDTELEKILKQKMGYSEGSNTCERCIFFVPCSGSEDAKPEHCDYNPSVNVRVSRHGHCNNFRQAKEIGK